MRAYSPGKSMVGVARFEPTTSSSRNLGKPVGGGQMRRMAVLTRRPRAALAVPGAVLRCCTCASGVRCVYGGSAVTVERIATSDNVQGCLVRQTGVCASRTGGRHGYSTVWRRGSCGGGHCAELVPGGVGMRIVPEAGGDRRGGCAVPWPRP